jgi:hypothetical protein
VHPLDLRHGRLQLRLDASPPLEHVLKHLTKRAAGSRSPLSDSRRINIFIIIVSMACVQSRRKARPPPHPQTEMTRTKTIKWIRPRLRARTMKIAAVVMQRFLALTQCTRIGTLAACTPRTRSPTSAPDICRYMPSYMPDIPMYMPRCTTTRMPSSTTVKNLSTLAL